MIDIKEMAVGDCIYANMTIQSAPIFCEIVKILDKENAVEVFTNMWGIRVVIAENAYLEEKKAKKSKIVRHTHNYKQWAKEYLSDEKTETDNRINPIHNGEPENCKDSGDSKANGNLQKSSKRKQKVVRKSSTKKRKSKRNRKSS